MTRLKLQQVLDDRTPKAIHKCCVYVIRDPDVVFYVGMSENDIVDRVRQHFGRGLYGRGAAFNKKDALGSLFEDNLPDSTEWLVEFRSLKECARFCNADPRSVAEAEVCMIAKLHPALNGTLNRSPQHLPERYTRKAAERQIETIRSVLTGE